MRAPWGGRGGPERGAAIAPRACPVRGCSHLESGCPCPQSPEEASAPFWVALDASRQKQAEAGARRSLGARSTPGFASPYFPVLKVTAAPSGEAKLCLPLSFSPGALCSTFGASDSAVLLQSRAKWSLCSLIFSLLVGVGFIGTQIGATESHVISPPQTLRHTHNQIDFQKSNPDWRPFPSHPVCCSGTEAQQPACGTTVSTQIIFLP